MLRTFSRIGLLAGALTTHGCSDAAGNSSAGAGAVAGAGGSSMAGAGVGGGGVGGTAGVGGQLTPGPPGPGLGAQDYDDEELFTVISYVDQDNGVPMGEAIPNLIKPFATNVAAMHNGYFFTLFASDSGISPGGFLFYDVSDPRSPVLVNRLYEPEGRTARFREAHAYGFSNFDGRQHLAIHTAKGIELWDLQNVMQPEQLSALDLPGVQGGDYNNVAWQLFWQGQHLYVAGSERGVYIVDVSDPLAPVLADRRGKPNPVPPSELGGFRVGPLFAVGNLLVVSSMDTAGGYAVLDISDGADPQLISSLRTGFDEFYSTCFTGNTIVGSVRGGGAKMTVHDITNPLDIALVNGDLVIDQQLYCGTQDEFVFQGNEHDIAKVDISDPENYSIVGRAELGRHDADHGQVVPFGNLLWVGNDHGSGSGFVVHQKERDTRPPAVTMVSPEADAQLVPLTSRIGLTLSDNILLESIDMESFIVRPVGGEALSGRFTVWLGIVNFDPDADLEPETTYEVIVPAGGLKDWSGNALEVEHRSTFTTAASPFSLGIGGLVGHWPLDEGVGKVARDASASERDGQLLGNPSWLDDGLDLDGADDSVALPEDALRELTDFSLTLWVRTSVSVGSGDPASWRNGQWLMDYANLAKTRGWALANHGGRAAFYVNSDAETLVTSSSISDGQWHHISAQRSSAGERWLYVDGQLEQHATGGSADAPGPVGTALFLGSNEGASNFADADLRDVRVYDRVLDESEIVLISAGEDQGSRLRATLEVPAPVALGTAAQLELEVVGPGDAIVRWSFGDGSAPTEWGSETSVSHSYAAPGHYQVVAEVSNGVQRTRASRTVTVHRPLATLAPTHASTIAYDATRDRVWAVNRDNDTLTALDAVSLAKLFEVPAGDTPHSVAVAPDASIWVVSRDDSLLRIFDGDSGVEQNTVPLGRGARPVSLAFSPTGDRAYAVLEGSAELLALSGTTGAVEVRVPVGVTPRGLAVSAASIFVSDLLSSATEGRIHQLDRSTLTPLSARSLPRDETTMDGEDRGRGVPNYLVSLALNPDGAELWVPAKSDNVLRGEARDGLALNHENTVRAILARFDEAGSELPRLDFNDRALPVDVSFTPLGDFAYIVLQGSNEVEIVDAFSGASVGAITGTGKAPQALAQSSDGTRVFVHNFLSRSVSVYDTSDVVAAVSFAPPLLNEISTVESEQLSATVLLGKQIFYDASDSRMSRDGYLSCATCHLDGGHDGQVWDFTDRGEGFRNTTDLRGRAGMGHGPVHWSGNFDEIQDFENDIRLAFGGSGFMTEDQWESGTRSEPLGDAKAGLSPDLDALAAYVASLIEVPLSPHRDPAGNLTLAATNGQAHFQSLGCGTCHAGPSFTDSALGTSHDVGTLSSTSGERLGEPLTGIDTPTLLGVWATAPYLHDGSAPTLLDVLTTRNASDAHGAVSTLTSGEVAELVQYLLELE